MKKREIDIFGILLGVVIGCILGFFLSSRINLSNNNGEEMVMSEQGNVHLLQIAKLDDHTEAINLLTELEKKGLNAVIVNKGNNYYYIFGGIASKSEDLVSIEAEFYDKGYTGIRIVKEYLLDKTNAVIENDQEYEFWSECINSLLDSLDNKSFEVSENFVKQKVDYELRFIILALREEYNEKLLKDLQLDAYQIIVEKLG
jgi:hypothetical protein